MPSPPVPPAVPEPPRALPAWGVAGVLALALLPRLVDALRTPLAFEEVYALLLARRGPGGIFATLALDVDQPLGFLVTWAWRALGGEGELWLKLPSILFGLLTVWAVMRVGRALFDARAGILAGLLLATHPTHVFYSQQASFPVLVWLLLLLALWSAWRWLAYDEARDGLAFVAWSALACFTWYFAAFVVAAIALWGAVRLRRHRGRLLRWTGLALAFAALCAPALPHLAWQLERDIFGDLSLRSLSPADLGDFVRKLAEHSLWLVAPLLALAALPLARPAQWRNASLLWFVILLGVLIPFELSVEGIHLFIVRQWMFALPLWCLLVGAGLSRLRWRRAALAAGVLVSLAGLRAWWQRGPLEEAVLMRRAEAVLAAEARPGDLVVCAETRALLFIHYHAPELPGLRLLVMRDAEPFHYSDGILAVPDAWVLDEAGWRRAASSGARWWGVRLTHHGRDGAEAAHAFDAVARGRRWRFEKATVWEGAPAPSGGAPAPPPVAAAPGEAGADRPPR